MTTSGYQIREIVEEAQVRWLKPGEVFFILQNSEEKQLTHKPPQKPPSGSLFLFDRKVQRFFRKDGHNWRRKKDSRTLGEAHERLKVGNVEALNCYYAHGEQNPSFQRRSYWMLNSTMEHIVLVHYRDTTLGRNIAGPHSAMSPGSPSTLVQSSTSYASQLTRSSADVSSEIGERYESSSSPSCIEVSSDRVTEGISDSPNSGIDQALRKIEEQLSLDEDQLKDIGAFYGENENSYDSGLTVDEQSYNLFRGFQGHDERLHSSQQTSFWNDMLIYDGSTKNDLSMLVPHELEDIKFSSYTPARDMNENIPDFYSAKFDQEQVRMPSQPDSNSTMTQEQRFTIREISPEWGYATESTKVFIMGTFTCDPSKCEWICIFGDTEVPVKIIQEGVICCQAPPRLPGKVTVFITSCNRKSCSEIREFEYRDKPSSYIHTNSTEKESCRSLEELLLLVRLVQMLLSDQVTQKQENTRIDEDSWDQVIEALLDGSLITFSATDWVLEQLLKNKLHQWLSSRSQDSYGSPALSIREQGIIHLISGLGFCWALSPILDSGVSVNFRDINGWTALHWAARFGREKMVAQLLASGAFAGAVTDPSNQDPTGKTAASIALTYGHKGLAGYLSEMSLTGHLSSLALQESQLSKTSANIEAERTVNSILNTNLVTNEDRLSLKDTLSAVRNATQAAARIQSSFRAHSFRKRQLKEFNEYATEEDEYGILSSDIEGLSAASKLTFRNSYDHGAVLSIQKKYRGWKCRKDFISLRQKVVKIQAHVRGHQVRKSYKVICWAVGMVEKIILRWRRKGTGLRGFRQELVSADDDGEDEEDIVKAFRKQTVDVAVGEAVSRVLSMVDSPPARQQYSRMLENHRQAKAERGGVGGEATLTSQGEVTNMEKDDFY